MRFLFSLVVLVLVIAACGNVEDKNISSDRQGERENGFQIKTLDEKTGLKKIIVSNPWEKAKDIYFDYYLVNRDNEVGDSLAGRKVIKTPVERVVCLSTTHLAYIDVLGENNTVVGISGSQYVSNSDIRHRMEQGKVPDVGYGQNLNYELIVNLKPDLVLLYGIGSEVMSISHKLEELGIPSVMVAEYLEESPLGKAGWIRFMGAFFEKEEVADDYFNRVEKEYNNLKDLAKERIYKPKVLVGSPYKDSWWVPGGNSYLANMIADAGGEYIGRNNSSHESYVISFENALAWGGEADIWMNMGNLSSKKEILAADQRFQSFKVFKEGKLYNNINRLSNHGGNDFWESGTVNPHLILRDLIKIFHPGLIEEELIYYTEIK